MDAALLNFTKSLHFVYPLSFESGDPDWPVYCGGTCFAITDGPQLFIITAKHCIEGRADDPLILGPTKTWFPLKQHIFLGSNTGELDWEDISCFTTYGAEHWPEMGPADAIDLNDLMTRKIFADDDSLLVVTGFPDFETEILEGTIVRKATLLVGRFGGRTNDPHCYFFRIVHPQLVAPNGLSGSPVLKVERGTNGAFSSKLLGMVIRGGEGSPMLRFIGVDVLIRMLQKIRRTAG